MNDSPFLVRLADAGDDDFILSLVERFVAFELPAWRRRGECQPEYGPPDRPLRRHGLAPPRTRHNYPGVLTPKGWAIGAGYGEPLRRLATPHGEVVAYSDFAVVYDRGRPSALLFFVPAPRRD